MVSPSELASAALANSHEMTGWAFWNGGTYFLGCLVEARGKREPDERTARAYMAVGRVLQALLPAITLGSYVFGRSRMLLLSAAAAGGVILINGGSALIPEDGKRVSEGIALMVRLSFVAIIFMKGRGLLGRLSGNIHGPAALFGGVAPAAAAALVGMIPVFCSSPKRTSP